MRSKICSGISISLKIKESQMSDSRVSHFNILTKKFLELQRKGSSLKNLGLQGSQIELDSYMLGTLSQVMKI